MSLTLLTWAGLRLRHRRKPEPPEAQAATLTQPDPTWAPHEHAAWETIRQLSAEADVTVLENHRLMLNCALRTIEGVARHYHPAQREPALHFTLPELLLMTERISARLRLMLLEQVPLSHKIKAGTLIRAWGYRPLVAAGVEYGRSLYSLVRFARAFSPLHAVAAELRDHLIGDLLDDLQANVRRRIVRLWIEEVGRAAIELYSGRLSVDAAELAAAGAAEGLEGAATLASPPGALRLLIAGQTNAGKSTLVNALIGDLAAGVDVLPMTADYEGYELRQEGMPPAFLIDSPGIENDASVKILVNRALACDLVVWVAAAHRADRLLDRAALDALRARFAANPQRKMPPLIVIASHVDRLSPAREWNPPYDVAAPETPKAQSIRAALDAIAADLDVPVATIIPMRLDTTPPDNIEGLWLRLEASSGEAQRARWVRILRSAQDQRGWRTSWKQVVGAGRKVGKLVRERRRTR
jgi:hypothetical protein